MREKSWFREFDDPIPLPCGLQSVTLHYEAAEGRAEPDGMADRYRGADHGGISSVSFFRSDHCCGEPLLRVRYRTDRWCYIRRERSSPRADVVLHEAPADMAASPLRRQAADTLRRARKLPVGADRNDLRQLALGFLWLEQQSEKALSHISALGREVMGRSDMMMTVRNSPLACRRDQPNLFAGSPPASYSANCAPPATRCIRVTWVKTSRRRPWSSTGCLFRDIAQARSFSRHRTAGLRTPCVFTDRFRAGLKNRVTCPASAWRYHWRDGRDACRSHSAFLSAAGFSPCRGTRPRSRSVCPCRNPITRNRSRRPRPE
jgi:hypothetical protein